jgi:hypothetical protein
VQDQTNTQSKKFKSSRRTFLKFAGSAAAISASAGTAVVAMPQEAQAAFDENKVIESGFPATGLYISPTLKSTKPFTCVAAYWTVAAGDGNALTIEVRTSADGKTFGDWAGSHSDHGDGRDVKKSRYVGQLLFLAGNYAQFRVNIPAGVTLKSVGLNFIDASAGPTAPQAMAMVAPQAAGAKPYVISRAGWGANESLRYNGGGEIWDREYRTPKIVLVHHSETTNTYSQNPAAEVRSIYYYHAVTQGWGDIGYNFLVDWKGNIYEGRAGGDDVVAGHALNFNYGSVGICLVGSFKTIGPTQAQQDALVRLIAWKCGHRNINPTATIWFVDRNMKCISGHRDVNNTSCPGQIAWNGLPTIRQRVAEEMGKPSEPEKTYGVAFQSLTFSPTTVSVEGLVKVEAVIKNTGQIPLESQNPAPGYVYTEGTTFETLGLDKENNKFRLAIDFAGNTGVSHPYRWGLGRTVQPGETVTVSGYIKMKNARQITLSGGIVQEFIKYHVQGANATKITVTSGGQGGGGGSTGLILPNPTQRVAARSADRNITFFPETGHNLGYGFRNYWQANGGLAIFGYPLTDEFEEVSATDGRKYIVQYFERNRFEYHPEFRGTPYEVSLGLLGSELNKDRVFAPGNPIPNTDSQMYFPETRHTLIGAFHRFWKENGGLRVFGYPVSEEFTERNPDDGKTYTVQYFERNRFEWHPEYRGTKYEVLLGLLGKELLRRKRWIA